jgi:hypothetical protein
MTKFHLKNDKWGLKVFGVWGGFEMYYTWVCVVLRYSVCSFRVYVLVRDPDMCVLCVRDLPIPTSISICPDGITPFPRL